MDTPTFVVKATDLLVVRCLNPDVKGGEKNDGLTLIEVEVLMVLKGERKVGKAKLATIGQRMEKGRRYLLASFGGSAFDTGFLAQSDQAVVELPPEFDLKSPDFVTDKLQYRVQRIFDARRAQVNRLIRQLRQEKAVLDRTAEHPTAPRNQWPNQALQQTAARRQACIVLAKLASNAFAPRSLGAHRWPRVQTHLPLTTKM